MSVLQTILKKFKETIDRITHIRYNDDMSVKHTIRKNKNKI